MDNNNKAWTMLCQRLDELHQDIQKIFDKIDIIKDYVDTLEHKMDSRLTALEIRHENFDEGLKEWRIRIDKKWNRRIAVFAIVISIIVPLTAVILEVLLK